MSINLTHESSDYTCTKTVRIDGVTWFHKDRVYRISETRSHQGDIRIRAVDLTTNEDFTFECLVTDKTYTNLLKSFSA